MAPKKKKKDESESEDDDSDVEDSGTEDEDEYDDEKDYPPWALNEEDDSEDDSEDDQPLKQKQDEKKKDPREFLVSEAYRPGNSLNQSAPLQCLRSSGLPTRPFQSRGATSMLRPNQKNMAYLWGMGLGKTHGFAVTVECLRQEEWVQHKRFHPTLCVASKTLIENLKSGLR
jgi:hypothetical protein